MKRRASLCVKVSGRAFKENNIIWLKLSFFSSLFIIQLVCNTLINFSFHLQILLACMKSNTSKLQDSIYKMVLQKTQELFNDLKCFYLQSSHLKQRLIWTEILRRIGVAFFLFNLYL